MTTAAAKDLLARIWRRTGFTVIANRRLDHYPAAGFLGKLLRFLEIDCVLDVGANTGQYHQFLRKCAGFDGNVVSFEPIPALADVLRRKAKRQRNWTIHEMALGAAPGRATFNIMQADQFSSFRTPDHSRMKLFKGMNRIKETIEVEVETLDRVLPALRERLGVSRIYLKLDTQGFDLEVVKGATASLAAVRGLQTEASVVPIYEATPNFATAIASLEQRGFAVSAIFPNNPRHFPRLVEFDCYMINCEFLPRFAR